MEIYPEELDMENEHHGSPATFLDLEIEIKDFFYCLCFFFTKDAFYLEIVWKAFICSNISFNIIYGATFSNALQKLFDLLFI